jgi:hypothetical protein
MTKNSDSIIGISGQFKSMAFFFNDVSFPVVFIKANPKYIGHMSTITANVVLFKKKQKLYLIVLTTDSETQYLPPNLLMSLIK